ncbi:hypothetical protein P280DRAFT_466193 [Massarina eburnea CBS 473.64]|uniref:Alpha/beta hydrolase fold-3 domain-containing protein n=1 Tax=Massarina eburnea CBS 473.64 TaxID=1395130 RepID=A0A6A6SFC1_9PLEO|nr:hypothetical protein P280DRAFT_466193 [Massarina eburnea CBS 473.64]
MGSSLFAPFFSLWLADLAVKNRAIIISADYRLLPTLRGAIDPLQDLEDFWQWTRKDLDAVLERRAPGHSVDLGKLMITGGSAGGYFGLQVALSHPDEVSVLAIQYPYVDVKDKVFTEGPGENDPTVLRWPKEQIPEEGEGLEWVEDARMKMVSKAGFERSAFNISLCTYGQFYSKVVDPLGLDVVELEPLRRIEAGAKLPKKM